MKPALLTVALLSLALLSAGGRKPFDMALERAVKIRSGEGTGMGVFVLDGRHVLTAAHVLQPGQEVWANRPGGPDMHCTVIRSDIGKDLSLLKVDGEGTPIPLGNGSHPGDPLFVISGGEHPFGYSGGHARKVYDATGSFVGREFSARVIETSAAISMGDSGSAICDEQGRLAGICSYFDAFKNDVYVGIDVSEIRAFLEGAWNR